MGCVRNGEFSRLSGSVQMLQEFLFCETDAVSVNALGVFGWHLGTVMEVGELRQGENIRKPNAFNELELKISACSPKGFSYLHVWLQNARNSRRVI